MPIGTMFDLYAKQTPEGRAFYPFGVYGAGYVVASRMEQRIKFWMIWFWVGYALALAISDLIPGPKLAKFAVIMVLAAMTYVSSFWYLLRDCRRTNVRLTQDELDHKRAAAFSFSFLHVGAAAAMIGAILAVWGFFVLPAPAVAIVPVVGLALCGYVGISLIRIYRIKKSSSSRSGLGRRV